MLCRAVSVLALLSLAALTACEPEDIEPVPQRGVVLLEGRYDLVVKDVVASACESDPGVMRGQVVPAELARAGAGVTFSFAGWMLEGEMEPGVLHVEGVVAEPEPVPVEEEEDDDDVVEEDDDRDTVEHGHGGEEGGGEGRPEVRASALLDARILEPELAEGSLFVSMPGCEVELSVVIGRGGPRGDRPTEPPVDGGEDSGGEEPVYEESDEREG